ncbi:hypothetical protein RA26_10990 [Leisingera sp. ANG-M7]|nr:hypothetical protein RA26_10990 [Leisingera sp. ANG-M7]
MMPECTERPHIVCIFAIAVLSVFFLEVQPAFSSKLGQVKLSRCLPARFNMPMAPAARHRGRARKTLLLAV